MTLEARLDDVLEHVLKNSSEKSVTSEQLIHCIDLTLLDDKASPEALELLKVQAQSNNVAAICVLMQHLHQFYPTNPIQLATVVNFPQGTDELNRCLKHIAEAKELGANEIDYVLPYHSYLEGNTRQVLASCDAISKACDNNQLILKIILETGAFPDMHSVYNISKELIAIGCNFLKTSTGKIPQGATLAAVFAILSAIKDTGSSCGVKVSGGVRSPQQALNYAHLAELIIEKRIASNWFRIGASSLLDELCKASRDC